MTATARRSVFLGKVWLLVAVIRLGLWATSFAVVRRLVRRWARSSRRVAASSQRRPEALAGAVRRVARFIPRASCLTQALAAEVLLGRAGYSPRLRIGCKRDDAGAFGAHAWIESGGQVVLQDGQVERFTRLPALGEP